MNTAPKWPSVREGCGYRLTPRVDIRGANALHVDVMTPSDRCSMLPPDGRGVTKDGSNLDWLKSGGSVLGYGVCEHARCYLCGNGMIKP